MSRTCSQSANCSANKKREKGKGKREKTISDQQSATSEFMPVSHAEALATLRKWSVLLDSAFRVPGTRLTFGLDPILGLIPGIGDLTTPIFAVLLLVQSVRMRIPRVVQLRMLINAA